MSAAETKSRTTVDEAKLEKFAESFVGDLGAVAHGATVLVGEKLGLYRAMADNQWTHPSEMAKRTGTDERLLTEWLRAQAASGYMDYDAPTGRFRLPPEQALALTSEHNPMFIPAGMQVAAALFKGVDKIATAMRTGRGLPWGEHDPDLFAGTERFFRPDYTHHLVQDWLPALDGVVDALKAGARVADVGCGHGASTVLMAQAFPNSTFVGFDFHGPSIETATRAARKVGLGERCRFEVATAQSFPGAGYDLVAFCDCLHDMGDPAGALARAKATLSPGGTVMLIEPAAADRVEDNLHALGRIFYAASSTVCTPNSQSQEVGAALGAQAGPARLTEVANEAGLTDVRLATQTPFNIVMQLRP